MIYLEMWWNMKFKNENINIKKAMEIANYQELLLKIRENNFLLSDYQINVLSINGIYYDKYINMHNLLFDINCILQDNYQEELDLVASQRGEVLYYAETKKWESISFFIYLFLLFDYIF